MFDIQVKEVFANSRKQILKELEPLKAKLTKLKKPQLIPKLEDYANFLLLKGLAKDWDASWFSPTFEVDELWHFHLLDPVDYIRVCTKCFGEIIGHASEGEFDGKRNDRLRRTQEAIKLFVIDAKTENQLRKKQEESVTADNDTEIDTDIETSDSECEDEYDFQIFVQADSNRRITLDVGPNMTVRSLKKKLKKPAKMRVGEQRLLFCGKQLEDNETLDACGITKESTLHVVRRLRGC